MRYCLIFLTHYTLHRRLMSSALKHREMNPAFQSNNENNPSPIKTEYEEINLSSRQQKRINYETHTVKQVPPKLVLDRADSAPALLVPVPVWEAARLWQPPQWGREREAQTGKEFTWKTWPQCCSGFDSCFSEAREGVEGGRILLLCYL